MRRILRKRIAVAVSVVAVLAVAGAAVAYFTTTGSGTGSAKVGTSTAWSVTFGTTTGTMYPGVGTSNVPYTITNPGAGHQYLAGTTALVVDSGGNVTQSGNVVPGCLSTWFTPTNHSPAAVDLGPGGTATGSVDVVMSDDPSIQDACKGVTPDIKVSAS
jgi:hypothetical protein